MQNSFYQNYMFLNHTAKTDKITIPVLLVSSFFEKEKRLSTQGLKFGAFIQRAFL